ncbi:MAG TPA: ABC transporter permease [Syntrophomonadaceae bacterium]|nr:ABC transporter permease [Syntrophomonadaceae bacterium]
MSTQARSVHKNSVTSYIFAVFFLLLGWEILARILNSPALPEPLPALIQFIRIFPQGLWEHFLVSTYRVVLSLFLGIALAVPLGLYIGREEKVDSFLAPHVYLLYPIPKIALLPVIFIIFKIGDTSKIFLITLIIFFQILVTTRDAAKKVPPASIISVLSLGASRWEIYRNVIIPACLPEIFTAVRISLGTAISVLFFAESFATIKGLGYFIFETWSRISYTEMFAGILALSLLGFFLFLLIDFLQRLLCPWLYV